MLKSCLLHPEILEALGRAGHSSKILIADGNYPFATQLGPKARLVSLNLSPGLVNITQVLEAPVRLRPAATHTSKQCRDHGVSLGTRFARI
jgi:L-fucose mutarotase